jgi:Ca2+-binding EF-hand superfamily protein
MNYTKHAIERFKTRFPELRKKDQHDKVTFHQLFTAAKETKRFINNTEFLVYLIERYGDYNNKYFENGDMIFVVVNDLVVTVMNADEPLTSSNKVFRKPPKSGFHKKV